MVTATAISSLQERIEGLFAGGLRAETSLGIAERLGVDEDTALVELIDRYRKWKETSQDEDSNSDNSDKEYASTFLFTEFTHCVFWDLSSIYFDISSSMILLEFSGHPKQ